MSLYDNYHRVKENISLACEQSKRANEEVQLIAVSKFHSIEAIKEVASYGQRDFGENYIQEALGKISLMPDLNWHAIGAIQSKKTKDIINTFKLIHTLGSNSFLEELVKRVPISSPQDVLLQINIGREAQKSGIMPEDIFAFFEQVLKHNNINVLGLMCLPPFDDEPENTRPYFIEMRNLKEKVEEEFKVKLKHLSMGMSGDFKVAIAEGATIIRVGTDIFGTRAKKI